MKQFGYIVDRIKVMVMLILLSTVVLGAAVESSIYLKENTVFRMVSSARASTFSVPYHSLTVGDCFRIVSRNPTLWSWNGSSAFTGYLSAGYPIEGRLSDIPIPEGTLPGVYEFDVMVGIISGGAVCYSDVTSLQLQILSESEDVTLTVCSGVKVEYTPECITAGLSDDEDFSWKRETVAGIREEGSEGVGGISEVLTNDTYKPVEVTYVYAVKANECSAETTYKVVVTVNPVIVFEIENRRPLLCEGDTTDIRIKPAGIEYDWSWVESGTEREVNGRGSAIRDVLSYDRTSGKAVYRITAGAENCQTEQTTWVEVNVLPEISLLMEAPDRKLSLGSPLTVVAMPDQYPEYQFRFNGQNVRQTENRLVRYDWKTGDRNEIAVTVTSEMGCENTATLIADKLNLTLTNVITPNGDGVNDLLFAGYDLEVYNRNGGQLYKGKEGWDGRYRGVLVPSGTYLYVVWMTMDDGQRVKREFYVYVKSH